MVIKWRQIWPVWQLEKPSSLSSLNNEISYLVQGLMYVSLRTCLCTTYPAHCSLLTLTLVIRGWRVRFLISRWLRFPGCPFTGTRGHLKHTFQYSPIVPFDSLIPFYHSLLLFYLSICCIIIPAIHNNEKYSKLIFY